MVATYLATTVPDDPEEAEYAEQCGRPSREERLAIWRLAVRLRLGGVDDPPQAQLWGDAVRRVALVGLLANAIVPISTLWLVPWLAGRLPWPPIPPAVRDMTTGSPFTGVQVVGEVAGLLWVVAFIAVVMGRRRIAVVAGGIAFLTGLQSLLTIVGFSYIHVPAFLITQLAHLLVTLLPLAALTAFHDQSPPVPRAPWLLALAATAIAAAGVAYVSFLPSAYVVDRPAMLTVAVAAAAIVHLVRRTSERADAVWSLALAIMAGAVLALRVLTELDMVITMDTSYEGLQLGLGVAQAMVLAVLGGVLWARAARALRDLPASDDHIPPPILTA